LFTEMVREWLVGPLSSQTRTNHETHRSAALRRGFGRADLGARCIRIWPSPGGARANPAKFDQSKIPIRLASGVERQPLSMFAVGSQPRAGFALGYGAIDLDHIEEGLARLRRSFGRAAGGVQRGLLRSSDQACARAALGRRGVFRGTRALLPRALLEPAR
jgi:hypothetical protein